MQRSPARLALLALVGCTAISDDGTQSRNVEPDDPPSDPTTEPPPADDGDDGRADCGSVAKRIVGAERISALTGDANALFWLEWSGVFPAEDQPFTLKSLTLATGEIKVLAENITFGTDLQLTSDFIFVASNNGTVLYRIPRAGGELEQISNVCCDAATFAVDDEWIFFEQPGNELNDARIFRMRTDAEPASAELFLVVEDREFLHDLEIGDGRLHFAAPFFGVLFNIIEVSLDTPVIDDSIGTNGIPWVEVGGGYLYAAHRPEGHESAIIRIPIGLDVEPIDTLALTDDGIEAFTLAGEELLFVLGGDTLVTMPAAGGDMKVLAAMSGGLFDPVATESCVYFARDELDGAANGIYRVAR